MRRRQLKHKKVYFAQYGSIWSFNFQDALKLIEQVIKDNCAYSLEGGRKLTREWTNRETVYEVTSSDLVFFPLDADIEEWKDFYNNLKGAG